MDRYVNFFFVTFLRYMIQIFSYDFLFQKIKKKIKNLLFIESQLIKLLNINFFRSFHIRTQQLLLTKGTNTQ